MSSTTRDAARRRATHDGTRRRAGVSGTGTVRRRAVAAATALAAAATLLAACAPLPGAPPPPSGPVNPVPAGSVGGFSTPWDLRFLPDGTPLVTERGGRVAAVVGGTRRLVATIADVWAQGEGGLMGLAVDPGFATNRWIYTCYARGAGGAVTDVRVVRFRVAEAFDALTDATPILTGIPAGAGNRHLGCRVEIGPDSMLWITTGDAVQATAPQDPTNLAGKVLRATTAGAPAPGNPGGAWNPYVYTIGHRNPQGLAFRPDDGAAFAVEHGTGCDDEVNLLVAGGNYGWNPVLPGGGYAEGAPMTGPGGRPAVWSSGCPTIAPSGATFVTGAGWGGARGALAVAVLKASRLRLFTLSGAGVAATQDVITDRGRLRTVRNAPDGSLWVVQDASPGALLRYMPG